MKGGNAIALGALGISRNSLNYQTIINLFLSKLVSNKGNAVNKMNWTVDCRISGIIRHLFLYRIN